jgi:hypothetical protein
MHRIVQSAGHPAFRLVSFGVAVNEGHAGMHCPNERRDPELGFSLPQEIADLRMPSTCSDAGGLRM